VLFRYHLCDLDIHSLLLFSHIDVLFFRAVSFCSAPLSLGLPRVLLLASLCRYSSPFPPSSHFFRVFFFWHFFSPLPCYRRSVDQPTPVHSLLPSLLLALDTVPTPTHACIPRDCPVVCHHRVLFPVIFRLSLSLSIWVYDFAHLTLHSVSSLPPPLKTHFLLRLGHGSGSTVPFSFCLSLFLNLISSLPALRIILYFD